MTRHLDSSFGTLNGVHLVPGKDSVFKISETRPGSNLINCAGRLEGVQVGPSVLGVIWLCNICGLNGRCRSRNSDGLYLSCCFLTLLLFTRFVSVRSGGGRV